MMLCAVLLSLALQAQNSEVVVTTKEIAPNVHRLEGRGGNILVLIGEKSILMVDSQYGNVTDRVLEGIRKISDKPISYLINTHWHGDHTGGNENIYKESQPKIVAHNNVKKRLSMPQHIRGRDVPALPVEAQPVETFADKKVITFEGQPIELIHLPNAHTDGDAMVYLKEQNVIHTGDTYFQGKYPFIDIETGGSVRGYLKAIQKVLSVANDQTVIVPGHRGVSNKKELAGYLIVLKTIVKRVEEAIKSGKSQTEIVADKSLTAEYDAGYGDWFINHERLITVMYEDLTK